MPIVFKKSHNSYNLLVWESTEDMAELEVKSGLTPKDIDLVHSFKSENRRREYLSVRTALKELCGSDCPGIIYDPYGKPSLDNGEFISISHSGSLIALILSKDKNLGVDIEFLREGIIPISRKFVSESEKSALSADQYVEQLHVIWGAKEVLFKIYGIGEMDFREDMVVQPFLLSDNKVKASIKKTDYFKEIELDFLLLKGAMLVWAAEAQ